MAPVRPIDASKAEELFSWIVEPARRFRKNARRAFKSPDAALDRLCASSRDEFERKFGEGNETLQSWLLELLEQVENFSEQHLRTTLRQTDGLFTWSEQAQRVWPIVEGAHFRHPNSPLIALPEPTGWGRAMFRSRAAFQEVLAPKRWAGEAWSRSVLKAFAQVADEVYFTYLVKLRLLCQLNAGIVPTKAPPHLGAVCRELAALSLPPELLLPDAAHIRNAAAHAHYRYLGKQRLALWERDSENRPGWESEMDCVDVLDRTRQMLDAAKGLSDALNTFMLHALSDLLVWTLTVMPAALRGELTPDESAALGENYHAQVKSLYDTIPREALCLHGVGEDQRLKFRA